MSFQKEACSHSIFVSLATIKFFILTSDATQYPLWRHFFTMSLTGGENMFKCPISHGKIHKIAVRMWESAFLLLGHARVSCRGHGPPQEVWRHTGGYLSTQHIVHSTARSNAGTLKLHQDGCCQCHVQRMLWGQTSICTIILLKSVCRCSQTAGRNSCSIVLGDVSNCSYRLTVHPVTSSHLSSA